MGYVLYILLIGLSGCDSESPSSAPPPAPPPAVPSPPATPPAAATPSAPTAPGIIKKELAFAKGSSSGTVEDAVLRGESHRIEFVANAEQQLDVSITSPEDNAIFRLYVLTPYGWNDRHNDDFNVAFVDIEVDPAGSPVGIDKERTSWSGKLPFGSKSGENSMYAIDVGATRGNATYTLSVSIE